MPTIKSALAFIAFVGGFTLALLTDSFPTLIVSWVVGLAGFCVLGQCVYFHRDDQHDSVYNPIRRPKDYQ